MTVTLSYWALPGVIILFAWAIVGFLELIGAEQSAFILSFLAAVITWFGIIAYIIMGIVWLVNNLHINIV